MSNQSEKQRVAVLGGGIVGLSCALWLQKKNFDVVLIDGARPGTATSAGSACTIATYSCVPINDPDLPRQLPGLMLRKDTPLSVKPLYALLHLPWMLSFLRHCRRQSVNRTITALGALLRRADAGLDPLIDDVGCADLFRKNGWLSVHDSDAAFSNARRIHEQRRQQGADIQEISKYEIHDLEPNLNKTFSRGFFMQDVRQVVSPAELARRYHQAFLENGGQFVNEYVQGVVHINDGLAIYLSSRNHLTAHFGIVASGAFSKSIEGSDIHKLPLDTERGYHVQYPGLQTLISRPIAWQDRGFYAVPAREGLRFAGTVEIAGLGKNKNPVRINYLKKYSRMMFDLPDEAPEEWIGYRPTMPDSLPVIGPAKDSEFLFYAFGHHHLGLTLAGITGKVISEMIAGEEPELDPAPYSVQRFTRKRDTASPVQSDL